MSCDDTLQCIVPSKAPAEEEWNESQKKYFFGRHNQDIDLLL